jgi:hypothetical protein
VAQQREVLEYSLAQQNFLITIESFLSTQVCLSALLPCSFISSVVQGHEMGMIEDMDAAVLWLSAVSIRFVNAIPETKVESKNEAEGGAPPSEKREKAKKR